MKKSIWLFAAQFILSVFFFAEVAAVYAKPPPWAPAHGYRNKKHDGYDDRYHSKDRFGISDGRCYRQSAGDYLGRVLGDSAGRNIGSYEGKALASVTGVLLGDVFDRKIGREMDGGD